MRLKDHLIDRNMLPSLYDHIHYDEDEYIVTFYLYNLSGAIVGYQQYRPNASKDKKNHPKEGRYYTYLPSKTDGVFGLDILDPTKRDVYIVEGIFKAATLHRLGYNAIAVLGNSPKRLKPWFKIMRQTWNLIGIGDDGKPGKLLVNAVGKGFQSEKDLDEMLDSDINSIIESFGKGIYNEERTT